MMASDVQALFAQYLYHPLLQMRDTSLSILNPIIAPLMPFLRPIINMFLHLYYTIFPSAMPLSWKFYYQTQSAIQSAGSLFSFPVLSVVALPFFSNWATSLNVVFFYMTWSTLVLSHAPINVEIFGTVFVRMLFYVLPALGFLAWDLSLPNVAKGTKHHGEHALPTQLGRKRLLSIAGVSIGNVLLGVALQVALELTLTNILHLRSLLRITTALPLPWQMVKDLAKSLIVHGGMQYYIHRYILHSPSRFPLPSRLHRTWQHAITIPPFSLLAAYDHPLCFILHHWIPTYAPVLSFRPHILTFQLYLALVSLEELLTYSGYSVLPSPIMLNGMARRQEAHFLSGGNGNYAPWGVLDWVHGTTADLGENDIMDDVGDEMEKHAMPDRIGSALGSLGDKVDGALTNGKSSNGTVKRGRGRPKKGAKKTAEAEAGAQDDE